MTLKTKNTPHVIAFIVLLYVGFAVANGLDWSFADTMKLGKTGLTFKNSVLTAGLYILGLVLTYLAPSQWKHRLIYARWHDPLPGNRVFTDLIDRDSRISRDSLVAKHGELPLATAEQNSLWYELYKAKQSDEVVSNSHGIWLLFREMFSVALVAAIPSAVGTFWLSGRTTGLMYTSLYLLLLAALWVCARNTGERFVCNVLAR